MKKNTFLLIAFFTIGFVSHLNAQPSFIWGKQFGTDKSDSGQDIVSYVSGEIVLTGSTTGNLFSDNNGKSDGYITKLDSLGNVIWKKQFGTKGEDKIWELEKDNLGNLYAAGTTKGKLDGEKKNNQDIIIFKFDVNGNQLEKKIIGTDSIDYLSEIYIDESLNIYIAGNTKGKLGDESYGNWDFFIMKLDSGFSEIFTFQFGTEDWDYCTDLIIDKNADINFCGFTMGNLGAENKGKSDAFIVKYSSHGKLKMIKQIGTENNENVSNIIIDEDFNLYLSGTSHGNIVSENNGKSDVFIMKLNNKWEKIWEKQFGTSSWDEAWHMDFINSENAILLSGSSNPDAYVRLYDNQGNLKWNQIFAAKGEKAGTGGRHFNVYRKKYAYFTGFTYADLFSKNPNQKEDDVFLVKLGLINE